ncbi:MAG TPA: DUF1697 domain-containing protein [Candidatus Saccharimonadales bacterium]|nr:DUF1697 domain-containing protein [Candidatus Saccharimonadales bacterium]
MAKYVALLRGVNVGGRIVKMADLKTCLEKAGLENVVTVLQSGNVVFESQLSSADLKKVIETTLTETFAYPAKAQVLSMNRLQKIVDGYPFGTASDRQHDYVIFIENALEEALLGETYNLAPGEQVQGGEGVVYWRVDKGLTLKSSFAKVLAKSKYRDLNTNRNIKTLKKLLAL